MAGIDVDRERQAGIASSDAVGAVSPADANGFAFDALIVIDPFSAPTSATGPHDRRALGVTTGEVVPGVMGLLVC